MKKNLNYVTNGEYYLCETENPYIFIFARNDGNELNYVEKYPIDLYQYYLCKKYSKSIDIKFSPYFFTEKIKDKNIIKIITKEEEKTKKLTYKKNDYKLL